jgi:hypothetical protein
MRIAVVDDDPQVLYRPKQALARSPAPRPQPLTLLVRNPARKQISS